MWLRTNKYEESAGGTLYCSPVCVLAMVMPSSLLSPLTSDTIEFKSTRMLFLFRLFDVQDTVTPSHLMNSHELPVLLF